MRKKTLLRHNENSNVVNLPAKGDFILGYHLSNWMVKQGKLIPDLVRFSLEAGVHGFEPDRNGKIINAPDILAWYERQGWTFLYEDDLDPHGLSYYNETIYRDGNGDKVYLTAFEKPVNYGSETVLEYDMDGYLEFVDQCMKLGIIEKPNAHFVKKWKQELEGRMDEYLAIDTPASLKKAQKLAGTIAVLEEYLNGSNKPSTKAKRITTNKEA